MSRRGATLAVSGFLTLGLGAGGAYLPVPYVGLGPGDTENTTGRSKRTNELLITVNDPARDFPANGHLELTTVAVYDHITLGTALRYWFDDEFAVVPREAIYPEGQSEEEINAEVAREMTESQQSATTAALRHLKVPVTTTIVVQKVEPGFPAAAALKESDIITAVDGTPVKDTAALRAAIGRRQPGEPVQIGYTRAGRSAAARVGTVRSSDGTNRPTIGVQLREDHKYPFEVKIQLDSVGGPSAGLMFALGIVDRLTPGDLTAGKFIAGTGTITDDGVVGPIGGIPQKLVGAKAAGAQWFLTPKDNMAEAADNKPEGLELIPVGTLQEALDAVRRIAAGG